MNYNFVESQQRINVEAVSDLLSEFDVVPGTLKNWKQQVQLLIAADQLNISTSRILIGLRLRDTALD